MAEAPFCYARRLQGILGMGDLSHEIEHVERAALEDLNAAATGALAESLGLHSTTIGTAYVSALGLLPASAIVVNRAIGLGLAEAAAKETVDAIVDHYHRAGVARYFVHAHPQARPEAIRDWLVSRGLEKTRGWAKFIRGREAPPGVDSPLTVRAAEPRDAEAFARIEADAFDLGPAAMGWLARLVGRPGWHVYMSFDGEEPAGAGVLYIDDGVGWIDWGATAPAFRGRRSQSALLRRRILDALDLGCRLLATTTGEEVPGDPQISYKNLLKMGFEELYVRDNYAPPKR